MSVHINATKGQIAEVVLMPGDPLRAKYIAEHYLTDVEQYNSVRNMFGYTGLYKGQRVSVQGSGMGIPSMMIYANELYTEFGVEKIIRIGSAGSIQPDVNVRDIVLAQGATTDSSIITNIFQGQVNFAPLASFDLLDKAYHLAKERGATVHVGNILSSDRFYNAELNKQKLQEYENNYKETGDVRDLRILAYSYVSLKKYDLAEKTYLQLIELEDYQPDYASLAQMYDYKTQNYENAIKY